MKKLLIILLFPIYIFSSSFSSSGNYYLTTYCDDSDFNANFPNILSSGTVRYPNVTIFLGQAYDNHGSCHNVYVPYQCDSGYYFNTNNSLFQYGCNYHCPTGQIYDNNASSCILPAPTCNPTTEVLNTTTNQCEPALGYHADSNGTSVPDINCPAPMKYKYTVVNWGLDTKGCFPDNNISEATCNATPGQAYAKISEDLNDPLSIYAMTMGSGCFDVAYAQNIASNANWHLYVSGLLPSMGQATTMLAQDLTKLFSSGKNLWKNIGTSFKNSPNNDVKLLTYKPNVTEMEMGTDGVFYDVTPTPMISADIPTTPSASDLAYNQFLKDNNYITDTQNVPDPIESMTYPTINNNLADLFYRGGDATNFTDNMLGTANIAKNGKVPNLSVVEALPLNKQVETTVSINSKLSGTLVKDYPAFVAMTKQTTLSDRVESTFKGSIKYPDNTKTDLTINRTKFLNDGHVIDDVTASHVVPTTSGSKTFSTNYQSYTDSSGAVTNIVNSPSSIISTTTSGGTTTTTNQSSNFVTTNSTQNAVNLSPVVEKLNSIDDKLKTIINTTVPPQIADASLKLTHFNTAVNLFDVNFNTYKDFINGLITNINDLKTLFDDSKAILENKPTVNEITGTCGFNASFFSGQTIFVDPCIFVAPYRPILALIFTLMGTFSVIGFAVKFLVARGD